jgi:Domain of unknown function (DUF4178)
MSKPAGSCPNCGAPLEFRFSSSVQTVCEYCKSIVVRKDVDLEKVGSVADLPANSSPIQMGAEGVYGNKAFTVAGRIIYDYEQGNWNEWHLVFNDGTSGWLSDAQLEYDVSFLAKESNPLPPSAQLNVGDRFYFDRVEYEVTSITHARYRGVEGELPFQYWDKTTVPFIDLRTPDARFATLDYSDDLPLLFLGETVAFDTLKLKNLRSFEGWN